MSKNSVIIFSLLGFFALNNLPSCKMVGDDNYFVWNTTGAGTTFTYDSEYIFDHRLKEMPLTFEATIKVPESIEERAGVILGDYADYCSCMNYEIAGNGNPRLYYSDSHGNVFDIVFDEVHVNTGERLHLAIVNDSFSNIFSCYVNANLVQEIHEILYKETPSLKMHVGGDSRCGNVQFFKGVIYNISLFSSTRSINDISNDCYKIKIDDKDLITAFDLGINLNNHLISSLNGNFNLIHDNLWVDSIDIPNDYSYSFAVVGDTQKMVYLWPDYYRNIYDYILDFKGRFNIACCVGLGDITEHNTDDEWKLAKKQISRMDGVIPYVLNCGNHDSPEQINHYFSGPDSFYTSTISGFYKKMHIENSYFKIDLFSQKYLILALDYGPEDDVLNWAYSIIENNQDCRVIITTHAYLFRDGTTLDRDDFCPPSEESRYKNNGDDIWNDLIRHCNVDLVLCGHDPSDSIIVSKQVNKYGDVVTQMLINPQGIDSVEPTGLVAILFFSNGGETIHVRYYSTVKKKWFKNENQFSININEL